MLTAIIVCFSTMSTPGTFVIGYLCSHTYINLFSFCKLLNFFCALVVIETNNQLHSFHLLIVRSCFDISILRIGRLIFMVSIQSASIVCSICFFAARLNKCLIIFKTFSFFKNISIPVCSRAFIGA